MASLEETMRIVILGDDTQLSPAMTRASSGVQRFAEMAADAGKKALLLEAAILSLATAYAVQAFNAAVKFESASADLNKVLSEQESNQLPEVQREVLALSDKYGVASTEILQSTANFKQAGFSLKDSMLLAKNSMDLVIAGGLGADEASRILVSTLKGFGAEATESTRIMDSLNEVSNNYASNVKELGTALADISGVAKLAGMSFEQTESLLVPIIEVFGSGSEAANALKTGLLKLIDDSKPVAAALESIGVSQFDANGKMRSAYDILMDVSRAFQGVDKNQQLFLTSQLVGIDQAARMVQVFSNLSKSNDILGTAMNSAGSAAKEVAIRLETSEVAVQRFKTAWDNLAVVIGTEFRDPVKGVINGATEMEIAFRKAVEAGAMDGMFDALAPQLKRVEDLFRAVAKNLPEAFKNVDFSGLVRAFGDLGAAAGHQFELIFGKLDLTSVEGLERAIQKAVNGIAILTEYVAGFVDGFSQISKLIGGAIEGFVQSDAQFAKTAGTVSSFMSQIIDFGLGATAVMTTLGGVVRDGQGAWDAFAGSMAVVKNMLDLIVDGTVLLLNKARIMYDGLTNVLTFGMFNDRIQQDIGEARSYIKAATAESATDVGELQAAFDRVGKATKSASEITRDAMEAVGVSAKSAADKTGAAAGTITSFAGLMAFLGEQGEDTAKKVDQSAQAVKKLGEASHAGENWIAVLDETGQEVSRTYLGFGEVARKAASSTEELGKSGKGTAQDLKKSSEDLKANLKTLMEGYLKLEEIAAREREVTIKAKAEVDVAKIEADAQVASAAFESLGNTITGVGDAIATMAGELNNATNPAAVNMLQLAILNNLRIQNEAAMRQNALVDAQVKMLNMKAKMLQEGKATIIVKGDGMEADLRQLMNTILVRAQIEANGQGVQQLLGI
ncbi:MAG: phage tail tape measure protein [Magnetococcales bacterium]|nr:phage tail tape measure protein [Magnetococcales bacterium]